MPLKFNAYPATFKADLTQHMELSHGAAIGEVDVRTLDEHHRILHSVNHFKWYPHNHPSALELREEL